MEELRLRGILFRTPNNESYQNEKGRTVNRDVNMLKKLSSDVSNSNVTCSLFENISSHSNLKIAEKTYTCYSSQNSESDTIIDSLNQNDLNCSDSDTVNYRSQSPTV